MWASMWSKGIKQRDADFYACGVGLWLAHVLGCVVRVREGDASCLTHPVLDCGCTPPTGRCCAHGCRAMLPDGSIVPLTAVLKATVIKQVRQGTATHCPEHSLGALLFMLFS